MKRFTVSFIFLVLVGGCGVKGPPLPPMKNQDQTVSLDKEKSEAGDSGLKEKDKKKKKKINAPFQF